ncbi:MAG TPA: universal stress protein [Acidobacteriaceae bacterium]|nr:universal stress protein [Acidobacteriaceae bacterium]
MDKLGEIADLPTGDELRLGTYKAKFREIVVGIDFSGPMITALNAATYFAEQYASTLVLVHAVPPVLFGPGATPELLEADLETARAQMEVVISKAKLGSIPHRIVIEFAEPTDLLDEVARMQGADLVIVGSHGAHGLEKLAFGSVAESVLRRAACPVLVVGPHCRENLESFRSIVFATGLETRAFRAAQYASSIAEDVNARLTLLHVRGPAAKGAEILASDIDNVLLQELEQLLPPDAEQWCQPKVRVEVGTASAEVLRVAKAEAANLIVVGVREGSTLADHSPRSTLSQIIRGADCPVLGVRGHLT